MNTKGCGVRQVLHLCASATLCEPEASGTLLTIADRALVVEHWLRAQKKTGPAGECGVSREIAIVLGRWYSPITMGTVVPGGARSSNWCGVDDENQKNTSNSSGNYRGYGQRLAWPLLAMEISVRSKS